MILSHSDHFRYYFVVAKNPGEQFYLFSLLAAWLIRKSGKQFEQPQEFDDPNDTIQKIIEAVKENVSFQETTTS